jgi:hypothetical protein
MRTTVLLIAMALGACAHPNQSGDSPGADPRAGTETRAGTEGRSENVPYAYRPGAGTVEYVTRIQADGSAAAGGTAGRMVDGVAYRLTLRMDDGTVQTVLQDSAGFSIGDRVRLTEDGRVIRL